MPQINNHPFQRRHLIPLVSLLLLATFLRLHDSAWADFRSDNAELALLSLDFIHTGEFPTKGMVTSRGVDHAPAMVYMMALPFALSPNPVFALIWIALWNVLGVALLYALAYRYFNHRVAFYAGLAFACSPWGILYSKILWNASLHIPLMIAGVWLGLLGFKEGRKWAQAGAILCLGLVPQMHFSGLSIIPLGFWLLWLGRRRLAWRALLIGAALVLLTLAPFFAGLSADEAAAYRDLFLGRGAESAETHLSNTPLTRLLNLTSGLDVESHISNKALDLHQLLMESVPRLTPLWYILALLAGVGAVAIWRYGAGMAVLMLAWLILPVLSTADASAVSAHYHYLILILPAPLLLIGLGLDAILNLARRYAPPSAILLKLGFALLLLMQTLWWFQASDYVSKNAAGNYGPPLKLLLPLREKLIQADNVLIVGGGANTNWAVIKPLIYPARCVREAITPEAKIALLPSEALTVFWSADADYVGVDPILRSLYTENPSASLYYPMRNYETAHWLFEFDSPPEWTNPPLHPVSAPRFENGAQIISYTYAEGQIFIAWALHPEMNDGHSDHYFMHFLAENGERLAQRDTAFWLPQYWCAGDQVVTWLPFDLPAEAKTLRIGMYRLTEGRFINRNLLDEAGNPSGQWLDLPLLP